MRQITRDDPVQGYWTTWTNDVNEHFMNQEKAAEVEERWEAIAMPDFGVQVTRRDGSRVLYPPPRTVTHT